ncbi:MAG: hypothetical protein IPK97_20555 [Ahniella sp.]|nr:hypothetical protein [Ahniella sp.]
MMALRTIIESPLFTKLWPDYWSEADHDALVLFLANNPDAGDLIPGSAAATL